MSADKSKSKAKAAKSRPPQVRRRFRALRVTLLLILLALASLCIPAVFQFALREAIVFEAFRHGATVEIGDVSGSLFERAIVKRARWTQRSRRGSQIVVSLQRAEADFVWRWRELTSPAFGRWFRRLSVEGADITVDLPPVRESAENAASPEPTTPSPWTPKFLRTASWPTPERIDAENVSFTIQSGGDTARIEDAGLTVSLVEPGVIRARQIVIHQPWLNRTFRNVRGAAAVRDGKLTLGGLLLEPGVEVQNLAVGRDDGAKGPLSANFSIAAFGGKLDGQIRPLSEHPGGGIDASGKFSQIQIAPLAAFLSLSDAAGGTIKDGNFTFRGTPRNPARATASTRFTADNFQWDSRQWDSLVFGATLMDRQIKILGFELHQGRDQKQNKLSLNGGFTLPTPPASWWQSDFDVNLTARIGNLTELSALLLPEFTYTAGRMSIDGFVRGHAAQFQGAVVVSGSGIKWRNAPIEDLHAGLRLNGNELEVANLDLVNNDDFVRGHGVLNILGPKQYWGEFHGAIADLATYASILQKPIVPEPLAGGAIIDWTGEGSAKGHSGKFSGRLKKVRTLGATGAMLHPINASLDGDYATESINFSRFAISDDETFLTANVSVGPEELNVGKIRLTHGNETWLEGDAALPLDVWQSWPKASLDTLLSDRTPVKVNLTAKGLQLREAAELTGWKWPIEGVVDGDLAAEGKLGALKSSGQVTLRAGRIPLGWSGDALAATEATVRFSEQTAAIDRFHAALPGEGEFDATGKIDFATPRDPALDLALTAKNFTLPLFPGLHYRALRKLGPMENIPVGQTLPDETALGLAYIKAIEGAPITGSFDLTLSGPVNSAALAGKAVVTAISFGGVPDTTGFWARSEGATLPAPFAWLSQPWRNWTLKINCTATEPITPQSSSGTVLPALEIAGAGSAPTLVGTVQLANVPIYTSAGVLTLGDGSSITFREGAERDPSLNIVAAGSIFDCAVDAYAVGPQSHALRFFDCEPPLTAEQVRQALSAPTGLSEAIPSESAWLQGTALLLTGNPPIFGWTTALPDDPNPEPAPALPNATPSIQ